MGCACGTQSSITEIPGKGNQKKETGKTKQKYETGKGDQKITSSLYSEDFETIHPTTDGGRKHLTQHSNKRQSNEENLKKVWNSILEKCKGGTALTHETLTSLMGGLLNWRGADNAEESPAVQHLLSHISHDAVVEAKEEQDRRRRVSDGGKQGIQTFQDFVDYYSIYSRLLDFYHVNEETVLEDLVSRHGKDAVMEEANLTDTTFYGMATALAKQLASQIFQERDIALLTRVTSHRATDRPTSLLRGGEDHQLRRAIATDSQLQKQYEINVPLPSGTAALSTDGPTRDDLLLYLMNRDSERVNLEEWDGEDCRRLPLGTMGLLDANPPRLSTHTEGDNESQSQTDRRRSVLTDYLETNFTIWSNFTKILLTESDSFRPFRSQVGTTEYTQYQQAQRAMGKSDSDLLSYENYLFDHWVSQCVEDTNRAVGRHDFRNSTGEGESAFLHWTDVRYLFEYMNLVNTVITCCEKNEKNVSQACLSQKNALNGLCSAFLKELDEVLNSGANGESVRKDFLRYNVNGIRDKVESLYKQLLQKGGNQSSPYLEFARSVSDLFVKEMRAISEDALNLTVLEVEEVNEPTGEFQLNGQKPNVNKGAHSCWPWPPLSLLLPRGGSAKQRAKRQTLFEFLDVNQRGYLMVSDLEKRVMDSRRQSLNPDHESAHNCFLLSQYRRKEENVAALLWRSFVLTKEIATLPEYNLDRNRVVIESIAPRTGERVLEPSEFKSFLSYLYLYYEYYLMFDLLLVWGVLPSDTRQTLTDSFIQGRSDASKAQIQKTFQEAYKQAFFSVEDAAYETVEKSLTVESFLNGKLLLEFWGYHVGDEGSLMEGPLSPWGPTGGKDPLCFTDFVLFASQNRLHPQGYGFHYSYCTVAPNQIEVNRRVRELEGKIMQMKKKGR